MKGLLSQTDMSGYSPMQAGTTGLLTAYEPTWKDRIARALMGDSKPSPERARLVEGLAGSRGMGTTGMGLLDFIPVAGQLLQAQEAIRSGDTDMLAMALMPGSKQVKAATGSADDAAKAGIRAYHGSPHDFDKFDMSKIGTGEGAQAYGHGLYFAEAEDVAKSYRDTLSSKRVRVEGPVLSPAHEHAKRLMEMTVGPAKGNAFESHSVDAALKSLDRFGKFIEREGVDTNKVRDIITSGELRYSPGKMYEVRINADPEDFLDWDKPLSQQSEKVRNAVAPLLQDRIADNRRVRDVQARMSGGEPVTPLLNVGDLLGANVARGKESALRDAGIPGIKYLDQGSRTAGEGSRNYVVFRDDIIDIVRKYGIAAAASMYGMDQVNAAMAQEQPKQKGLLP